MPIYCYQCNHPGSACCLWVPERGVLGLTAVFVLIVGSVVACGRTRWICVSVWSLRSTVG